MSSQCYPDPQTTRYVTRRLYPTTTTETYSSSSTPELYYDTSPTMSTSSTYSTSPTSPGFSYYEIYSPGSSSYRDEQALYLDAQAAFKREQAALKREQAALKGEQESLKDEQARYKREQSSFRDPRSAFRETQPSYREGQPIYYCLYSGCEHGSARKADLERHVQVTHLRESLNLVDCQIVGCHRKGKYGFTRKDKMVDHMRDVHKADIPKRKSSGGGQGGIVVRR